MGLATGGYNISLDARDPESNVSFVSHAHSDHTAGLRKGRKVIASSITWKLMSARGKKGTELIRAPEEIELLDAGHILGSKQLLAQSEETGISILYSGDYQMQVSEVAERIEIKEADVLILDSTYPYKDVIFDHRENVIDAIQKYLSYKSEKGIVLFSAYALGKAQELIRIANEVGIVPVVDGRIAEMNEIYVESGIPLEYFSFGSDSEGIDTEIRGNFVGITSSHTGKVKQSISHAYGRRVFTAIATGFAKMSNLGKDVQFPLSDHADLAQAKEYIELCNPKIIYTYGGRENSIAMAENLRDSGYNAHPYFLRGKTNLLDSSLITQRV
jgi:putative mRNA 3-end processing factor